MLLYLKLQKQTNKQKARISHFKVHPVSSFAPRISGLHTFGRKQVVNNDFFASQPCTTECTARFSQRLYLESSQTCICLAVILMHQPGWIVLMNYFDTRHTIVFDLFECSLFGLMHHHLWSKSRCSARLAS